MNRIKQSNKKRKNCSSQEKQSKKVKFNEEVKVKLIPVDKDKKPKRQLSGAAKRKRRKMNQMRAPSTADEDDAIIAQMEKNLKIKKGKRMKSCGDDLDSILDLIEFGANSCKKEEEEVNLLVDDSEDGEDLDDLKELLEKESDEDEDEDHKIEDEEDDTMEDEEHHEMEDDLETEDEEADYEIEDEDEEEIKDLKKKSEDEYSKKDDDLKVQSSIQSTNTGGKYIPPSKRALMTNGEEESVANIRRQVKGQLNRLSEDNIASIVPILRKLGESRGRARVHDVIISLILEEVDVCDPLPERLISEAVMLVVIMTSHTGIGLLASFVERTCKRFVHTLSVAKQPNTVGGKNANNLLRALCSLYELKAVQKQIIYDVIELLISEKEVMQEKEVELLLLIFKKIGFQLRRDDPIQMKKIVVMVTPQSRGAPVGSRMRFMLDVISAVKNNNIQKIQDYDVDVINKRRKKVKSCMASEIDEFADVKLKELLEADETGRWWLVGSAWKGRQSNEITEVTGVEEVSGEVSQKLQDAAKKMRMNTDIRKKIFYAVMGSSDFEEAFNNICRLDLKGKQLREIGSVLVECCIQQRHFNKFYVFLIHKFCKSNRDYVVIFQCSLWDRFKLIDSMSERKKTNLSKLLSDLLLNSALTINCFKSIKFTEISPPIIDFLRRVFILLAQSSSSIEKMTSVFEKRSKHQKHVRLGLRLFLLHFMIKDANFMTSQRHLTEHFEAMNNALAS